MYKWKKLGKVFNPEDMKDIAWMHEYAQAPATLLFDDFVRVYFSCRPERDSAGQFVSYSAFVDLDRKDLFNILNVSQKPILELGKKGCFDEFGTYPVSPLRVGDETWVYYGGWTRCSSVPFDVSIGIAKSDDDGKTFQKLGDGPILSFSPDEPIVLSGPKVRKFNDTFYLFYISGRKWVLVNGRPEFSTKIRMATSDDGLTWNKINENLISDVLGGDESQASPDVIYKNGKYHMFFCYWDPHKFRETKARRIGYASSEDLIHWTRDDSQAGITVSDDSTSFDNEMVAYPHVFEMDGKMFMLYLGNEVGRHGFGLAELEGEL